jgi:hypothetical protein
MKNPLLVRHPPPHPTESLMGYLLRLSEQNGYCTPWSLCVLAGMKQNEFRTSSLSFKKLAAISSRPHSELEILAFSAPPNQPRWARLLGNPVVPTDLDVTSPRLCPQCVAEKGFIEAHWHLRLMIACPIHLRLAAVTCPVCRRRLRWFRPGLLECECGGSLSDELPPAVSQTEGSLLAAIRNRALGGISDSGNPARLPLNQLMTMNLRSILSMVRTLGRYRLMANATPSGSDQLQIAFAATEVLREWPANFIQLLHDLGKAFPANISGGVGKQFEGIYRALFRNKAIDLREQTDFLKSAFLDFGINHWGRGFVDRKLMALASGPERRRFVTQSEFAARLGIQPRTVARLLKSHEISADRVRCGSADRIIIDADHNLTHGTQPGKILRDRTAARRLGLPVPVLLRLRSTGEFDARNLSTTRPGWHEKDVEAFKQKFLALLRSPSGTAFDSGKTITLIAIMQNRHLSSVVKADLIRTLLSKELPALASSDGMIVKTELDLHLYKRWAENARSQEAGKTRTPTEVAKYLQCDRGTVPGLMGLGLLKGIRTAVGLRIYDDSLRQFNQEYVSLASQARRVGQSTRALMRRCEKDCVQMLLVPVVRRAGSQPFIRIADLESFRLGAA